VFFHSVCSLICRWFGRAVRLACAALLLLLAAHTKSSAGTLYPSGHGTLLHASTLAGSPASDENDTNGVQAGASSKENLIRKATFANNTSSHAGTTAAPAAEADAGESTSHTTAAESRVPDWDGVWRDTGILFSSQFVVAGFIYIMPESFSNWSSEQKKNSFNKYAKNVVDPVIDKDQFYVNYVLLRSFILR
jgi:hypothetical protein